MTLGRFPRGLIAILALPQASCTSASISQGVAVPTQTLENCPLPAVLSIYQYYASSLAASSSVSVVFGSGTSLDGGCDATSSGGDGSSQTSTGGSSSTTSAHSYTSSTADVTLSSTSTTTRVQASSTETASSEHYGVLTYQLGANVLMIDHTANDTPYKSTATGNGYTNYTVSLVSDAPNKSTRYFKIYKPDGDGDFGPDVDGSQFLHVVKCDITFSPGSDDNKPVMAVWDETPWYTGSDPEGTVEPDCAESDVDV